MELRLLLCVIGVVVAASPKHYDTIVVGLGSAGVTAATTLAAGRRVLGIEAQGRVAGRVHTVAFGDGVVELGGEWVLGTENSRTYAAAQQHNVTIIPQDSSMLVYYSDGTPADAQLISQLAKHSFDEGPEPPEAQGNFTTRKIMEDITKNRPDLLKDQEFISGLLSLVELMVDNLEGSSDWNEVTTGGDYADLEGHQGLSWHRHGYKTFFDIMLNTYKGGPGLPNLDIKLNTEVKVIRTPQHPTERVTVECGDGSSYVADNVIVTVSLGVLKDKQSTLFSPPLPEDKQTAIDKISMGVLDKIILTFDQPWWTQNISRFLFIWKEADMKKVPASDLWTTKILGASRPMGSSNTLTLWISGNIAKEVEMLPEDTVKAKCVELLQRFMGDTLNITVPQPTAILRTTWYSNPYTRGSYTFDNILTPQYPDARDWLARPIVDSSGAPRVLFAGEATSRRHFGTVHGASETGYREAMRLVNKLI
ncbi:peroxisomal N(1)-acetyl-spermine/spermidine oxidase-like [Cydia pomonella]|uniref:peroxisomal N(1)-acetyl-spermine/spermidine oxidase-like n=1 Tax=Cydia pomonella TaxID=82600 RepID=UPI002ADE7007|nr:peroxisomal N(1)-acetyl-spermine/spermidine oxidase-like [Cydia pomonella]